MHKVSAVTNVSLLCTVICVYDNWGCGQEEIQEKNKNSTL